MQNNNIYIGVDPSVNSTGVCMDIYIKDKRYLLFFIVHPDGKLTKRESSVNNMIIEKDGTRVMFSYISYKKHNYTVFKDDHIKEEKYKTISLINLADAIDNSIESILAHFEIIDNIHLVQEGISYGSSLRTKSIYDLAGLNWLLRERFLTKDNLYNIYITPPSEIKKFAVGKGNAKKDVIISSFLKLYPEMSAIPKIDDIADAYFMSQYAQYLSLSKNSEKNKPET